MQFCGNLLALLNLRSGSHTARCSERRAVAAPLDVEYFAYPRPYQPMTGEYLGELNISFQNSTRVQRLKMPRSLQQRLKGDAPSAAVIGGFQGPCRTDTAILCVQYGTETHAATLCPGQSPPWSSVSRDVDSLHSLMLPKRSFNLSRFAVCI